MPPGTDAAIAAAAAHGYCWWTPEKQGEVLAQAADRIAEHLIQLVDDRVRKRSG
jgi:acyl-CoA reductase-like NAD-dependent aldehyde dehydrogenase